MTRDEALAVVEEAIAGIVPDADFARLGPGEPFRDALEMDSLDFLRFVETLGERTGCRIDEDGYPELTTLDGAAGFLVAHTA